MKLVPSLALLSVLLAATPVSKILDKFTAPGVPAMGEHEIAVRPRRPVEPTTMTVSDLPGNGLARHPMVYIGEGDAMHGRFRLTGDAVNTAARLCARAERNEILVSETELLIPDD